MDMCSNIDPNLKSRFQRGVATIEFSILIVPLLLMLFGVTEYGRAIYQYNTLVKSVRNATRLLSTVQAGSSYAAARCLAVYGTMNCSGTPLAAGLTTGMVSICDASSCAATHASQATGSGTINLVTVTISGYQFRTLAFDGWFDGAALVPTARKQAGEMGLDLEAAGRVHLDTEERGRKRPRAFCAPVRVPHEVHLVIRPHGGYTDWRAFWHELGHALHFANAGADLPFEHQWLGDNSVTECYAMLFEHALMVRAWLRRYTGLAGERLAAFLRDQAFAQLAIVRRYAAKLRYEVELRRAASLREGAFIFCMTARSRQGEKDNN